MQMDVSLLIKTLTEQQDLIEDLCDLAAQQLQALKNNDADKIRVITGHQEFTGRQLAETEQKRRLQLERYSKEQGIKINHLSELEMYISGSEYEQVQMLRDGIVNNYQGLKEALELNALLLKQNLQYTDRILGVLNARSPMIYGRSLEVHPAGGRGIIDTNA